MIAKRKKKLLKEYSEKNRNDKMDYYFSFKWIFHESFYVAYKYCGY